MKATLGILLAIMINLPLGSKAAAPPSFSTCNDLYHAGSYQAAADCYEALTSDGYSAELFYNLGNSYAQLGKTGYGVLNYLRGLTISPGDSELRANLEALKKDQGLFDREKNFPGKLINLLSLYQWCWLLVGLFAIHIMVSIVVYRRRVLSRPKETALNLMLIVLALFCLWGVVMRYQQWQQLVVINDSRLLISPIESGSTGVAIKQGSTVTTLKKYKGFELVTDDFGRRGWLKRNDLEPVMKN